MRKEPSSATVEAIVVLVALAIAVGAGLIGWFVGHEVAAATPTETAVTATEASLPPDHVGGPNLSVAAIGDPAKGADLFETKACVDCHSFNGEGGEDAPPLDSMTGHLSAREIAAMSGQIWNHLPEMLEHFEEEGIAFPTFSDEEMADLIAYLHGGAPAGTGTSSSTGTETGMQMETGSP